MEEVIIGTEQGTTFPTKIGTSMCNALIDTGATKSCISERYYQQLPSTKIQCLKNISVISATGSNLTPLGMINCSFELRKIRFNSNLIVCKNLTRPVILGRDFLMQNHITVQYAENGKCILDYQQHELIASIDVEDKPHLNMTHSVMLPGRTLAIVCIYNNLDPNQCGYIYEIEPCSQLIEKYPNLCVIPMIHNVDVHKTKHIQRCYQCQRRNKQVVKYATLHFDVATFPMQFISMDLIGEFHPPTTKGKTYALTVICMPYRLRILYTTKNQNC